jgi:fatty-acyl-CoA synthase
MLRGDILGERARLTPDQVAVVYVPTGERVTYGQLDRRATACARAWVHSLGLRKGDRVAILANNRLEFLEAYFAAIKSGTVLVPLGTKLTPSELEYILRDSGARALIHASCAAEAVRALARRMSLDHWLALDDPAVAGDTPYGDVQAAGAAAEAELPSTEPEDLCALLYTSGTTGRPKGVMIPQRMVGWNAYNTAVCWQLRDTDVSPVFTPLYHAGGFGVFITPIFAVGGTIVLHDGFNAGEVLRVMETECCTVALGVPTIFRFLLRHESFDATDLSRVRWLISGGAPLPPQLVEAYRRKGIVLRQGYGLTEVGVNCFSMTSREAITHAGAVGRPMMFTEARLVGEDGREAREGEVGELLLRGPHVSKGYWNNLAATAESYEPEGWFRTGDLAVQDESGMVSIVGRRTDMFISGGVNVYPPEVEAELLQHEGVADAAVLGVPDPTWGETGVAFVLAKPGLRLTHEELVTYLQGRLAKYKIPKDFVFVASLPRTPYGKVRKRELREAYVDGIVETVSPSPGSGRLEASVVA